MTTQRDELKRRITEMTYHQEEIDGVGIRNIPLSDEIVDAIIDFIEKRTDSIVAEVLGEDEDLNAPAETYGKDDQSLGDNPHPNPNLQYVVRRATRNVFRAERSQRYQQIKEGLL